MALLLHHLGSEAAQVLRIFRSLVALARTLLPALLVGVQPGGIGISTMALEIWSGLLQCLPLAVQLLPSLNVLVLGHAGTLF